MSISNVGTIYTDSNNSNLTISIEIPSNANCILISSFGYATPHFTKLNFDDSIGITFTTIKGQRWDAGYAFAGTKGEGL